MPDEMGVKYDEGREELAEELSKAGKKVVKVAASAVVATTLVSALQEPPRADLMSLPEPTPIVQQYVAYEEDPVPDEDETEDEETSRWKRILRILKYLMVTLALLGTIALGILKGCAGIIAAPIVPDDEKQEQEQRPRNSANQDGEDERGVAN